MTRGGRGRTIGRRAGDRPADERRVGERPALRLPSWTLCKVSFRLALILMTCSLFLCRDVRSPEELAHVPLGLPIPFVTLDATARAPLEYPACFRFGNPHDRSMRLRPLAALADLSLLTLALIVGSRLVARLREPRRAETDRRRRPFTRDR